MPLSKVLWTLLLVVSQTNCGRNESPATPAAGTAAAGSSGSSTTAPATTRSAAEEQALEEKLYGTWVARDVDAKLGDVKIKLTFRREGPMKLAAWSDIPFVGQVRDKKAPFEVHGDVISSSAIRGGISVKYWFDGEQLVIRYKEGKTVHFTRQ